MQSKRTWLILTIIVAAAIVVVGLVLFSPKTSPAPTATTSNPTPTAPPTPQETDQVTSNEVTAVDATIQNFDFQPNELRVKKGTTVTWTNQDSASHNVVSDDSSPAGGPNGPLIGKGQKYSFTFNNVGTFNYHCSPHPNMRGTVVVTP